MMQSIRCRNPETLQVLELEVMDGVLVSIHISQRQDPEQDTDLWLCPALVDLQVNGYGGIDLNRDDLTPDDVVALVRVLARLGTTRFLPTIITASFEKTSYLLRIIKEARETNPSVRHAIPGVHLEGPSISDMDGYRGAHDARHVRPPSLAELESWQKVSGLVCLVTMSPHWQETETFIRALRAQGVVVAIGHTHATPDQIRSAVNSGATLSTHLGNGIAAELPRHPNAIWTQLADERLAATFIADGIHLDRDTFRAMLRAKGTERSVLVSDSVALAGSPAGRYTAPVGGDVVVGNDGSIRLHESGLLAGSGIALRDAVARAALLGGITLGEAVKMATRNAAAAIGLHGWKETGITADLLLFRWKDGDLSLDVQDIFVRGRSQFSEPKGEEEK